MSDYNWEYRKEVGKEEGISEKRLESGSGKKRDEKTID